MAAFFSKSKPWLFSLFIFICFYAVAFLVQVNGDSMVPSLTGNQIALVARQTKIERFDIIVIRDKEKSDKLVIKRVIGLPGEELLYKDDQLFINNQPVSEPFLAEMKAALAKDTLLTENIEKIKIPDHSYYVLGDNRKISLDSRSIGTIHEEAILGEAKFLLWPPKKINENEQEEVE